LLISDIGLPDGTGLDLPKSFKYKTPAIALSGYGNPSDIAACSEADFSEHLLKPVQLTQLTAAIERLQSR
jgi:CheY-like chemotaxis protein